MVEVVSFYRFWETPPEPLDALRQRLLALPGLKGLVILAPEGINATASGAVEPLLQYAGSVRRSRCERHPFRRWKVCVQDECVTTGWSGGGPGTHHLSPAEWDSMLEGEVTLIDVRNDYEVRLGSFPGALDLGMRGFREFPELVQELPRERPVLMYCTGGIRCEKALPFLQGQGHEVYQLEGGILNYLEQRGQGKFRGECFVFDERVALDHRLEPSRRFQLCPRCGQPGCAC